ncbi:MAG: hypothetical protein VX777_06030 [Chlamydiota bacterium]|nr:hypothetical protein [Chlamydiota bacterium]
MIHSTSEPVLKRGHSKSSHRPKNATEQTQKTSGVWGSSLNFMSGLYHSAKNGVVSSSIALIRPQVIKNNFTKENAINTKKLDSLSGSSNLSKLILILSPYITKFINEKISDLIKENEFRGKGIAEQFFRSQDQFLENYFQALILRIFTNFAKHTEKVRQGIDQKGTFTDDLVVSCVEKLLSFVQLQFKKIDINEFVSLQDQVDNELAVEKMRLLFADTVTDFMKIIFPNAENDLTFGNEYLSGWVIPKLWEKLKSFWIPDVFIKLYKYHNLPDHHSHDDLQVLQLPGGDVIKKGISISSEETVIHLPQLLSGEVEGYAKMLPNYLEISDDMKSEYAIWLSDKLISLLNSRHPAMEAFWKVTEEHLTSLLTRHIGKLAKISSEDSGSLHNEFHLFPCIINNIFTIINEFVKELNTECVDDQMFKPLTTLLLDLVGFDYHKKELVTLLRDHILPKHAHEIFVDIREPLNCIEKKERELCQYYYDPEVVMGHFGDSTPKSIETFFSSITAGQDRFSIHQEELWDLTGAKRMKDQLKRIAGTIGEDIRAFFIDMMSKDSDKIVEMINVTLPRQNFEGSYAESLALGLKRVADSDNPSVLATLDYIEKHVTALVFKGMVNLIVHSPGVLTDQENQLFPLNIALKFFRITKNKLLNLKEKFLQAEQSEDPKTELRHLFAGFSTDLVDMVFPNFADELPIPRLFKSHVIEALKTKLIPDYIASSYRQLMAWDFEEEETIRGLQRTFGTTYPGEACRIVGEFTKQVLPYFFFRYDDSVSGALLEKIIYYFREKSTGKEKNQILSDIEESSVTLEHLIKKNIKTLGAIENVPDIDLETPESINELWAFSADITKAFTLKMLHNIGKKIDDLENPTSSKYDKDFLLKISVPILQAVTEHFNRINKVKRDTNKANAFEVTYESIVSAYSDEIHAALPRDLSTPSWEQDKERIDKFFKDFSQKLFELADFTDITMMPFPDPLKGDLYNIAKNELVPRVALSIFQKIMEPHSLNVILLSILEIFNETVEEAPENTLDEYCDEDQKKLNRICGELAVEVVELIPTAFTKSIFKFSKVKAVTAEKLGRSLRKQLNSTSIKKMVNKLIVNGLPMLHLGEFKGEPRKERFCTQKLRLGPNGINVAEPAPFDMNFPKSEEAINVYEAVKKKNAATLEVKLRKTLSKTIATEIESASIEFFRSNWIRFQRAWDLLIKKYLGAIGAKTKKFLDIVFGFIVFRIVFSCLRVLMFPLYKLGGVLLNSYLSERAADIIKDYHMTIHESCAYQVMDIIINSFSRSIE